MADLSELYSATLKGSGVDLPPNQIETIADQKRPQSDGTNSLPANFISFYNNVIGFISQYEKAFEEENFNRMNHFVIAVSEAIIDYFKKAKKNSNDELQAELKGISEDTANIAAALIKQKQEKAFDEEELKDRILGVVETYKEKILDKIKDQVLSLRPSSGEGRASTSAAKKKQVADVAKATMDSANEELKKNAEEYRTEIEKFSIRLGATIIHEFKENVKKLTQYNLISFERGINRLDKAYSNYFYNIVNETNASINRSQGRLKAGLSKIGKVLKYSAITMTNTVTLAITGFTYLYLGGKLFVKTLWFWGGKVLAPVKHLLGLGLKLVTGAINFAFKAVKFVVNGIYTTGKFLVKTTFRVLNKTYSLATNIWKKVFGFSFWGFVKGMVSAFIFSYPGAYFLGYLSGRIWGGILRLAGLSDEDIRNGNYHIKDDVLMPLFETIKGKITGIFGEGSNLFSKWKDKLTNKGAGLLEEFKQTKVYQRIESLKAKIAPTWKYVIEHVRPFVEQVKEFYNSYVEPVVGVLASILSVFGEGLIEAPQMFLRSRYGAMVGLMKSSAYFVKHIKIRGGIAGIIASAIAIGAGMILGTNTKKETEKNDGDVGNPLKMPIASKFAFLYGGDYNVGDEEAFSKYEGYRTALQIKEDILGKLLQQAHKMPKGTEALSKEYYNKARYAYAKIQSEIDFANSSELMLKDLLREYERDSANNIKWKASDYQGIVDLLMYNDKYIIEPSALDNLQPLAQIGLLNAIVLQRKTRAQDELETFKRLANGENGLRDVANYFEGIDERFLKVKTFVGGDFNAAADKLDYKFELALNDLEDTYKDYQQSFLLDTLSRQKIRQMNAPLMRTQIKTRASGIISPSGWAGMDKSEKEKAEELWWQATNEDYLTAQRMGLKGSGIDVFRENPIMPNVIDIMGTFDSSKFANNSFQNTLTYLDHIANIFQDTFMDMLHKDGSYTKYKSSFDRFNVLMRQQIDTTIKSITAEDGLKDIGSNDLISIGYNVFERSLNSINIQESDDGMKDLQELITNLRANTKNFKQTLITAVNNLQSDKLMTSDLLKEVNAYISKLKNNDKQ